MALLSSMSIPTYGMSNISSNGTQGLGGEIKIPGTGLTLYGGGKEKTPTGMSNAAIVGNVTPQRILTAIKEYQLPTTSNMDFQEALIKKLATTEYGQQKLAEMEKAYGKTKSGNFVDNILGARTQFLLDGLDEFNKIKKIDEDRPAYISTGFKGQPTEKILDFGKNQKASRGYWDYYTNLPSGDPRMISHLDSARKNIAPAGAKYLTTMAEMAPIYNYEKAARDDYYKQFGKYPPTGPAAKKILVQLPEGKQYEALKKYLGFQK